MPVWNSVEYFKKHELKTNAPKTKRLRSFQIGGLELVGCAVGASDAYEIAAFSKAPLERKYGTWYLNKGNKVAERIFNHEYMAGPYFGWLPWFPVKSLPNWVPLIGGEVLGHKRIVKAYKKRMEKHWEEMVKCAEDFGYVAMGCDGHRHRGPSVFAAFLALSGCDPDTATDIANELWGLNGVPDFTREAIAKIGWDLGNQNPELRARLQKVMSTV